MELSTDQFDVMKLSLSYFNEVSNVEGLMDHELVEPKALALAALNKLKVGRIDFNAEDLRILYVSLSFYKTHLTKSLNPLLNDKDSYFQAKSYLPIVDNLITYLEREFSKFPAGREFLNLSL